MPFYPFKGDCVFVLKGVKLFPKIAILNRLCAREALDLPNPGSLLPPVKPLRQALLDILGVRRHQDGARFFQSAESGYHRLQLHAIVGRLWLAPIKLLFVFPISQDASPATRTRVPDAGAIGYESDFLRHLHAPLRAKKDMQESTLCHRARRKSDAGKKGENQQPACHGCTNPSI
jgi:hypothetical protein